MRVLVTGASGFVGSHTTAALVDAGHDVRIFVRNMEKTRSVYERLGLAVPEHVVGDIKDADACKEALSGCDSVVHAAAVVALEKHRANEVLTTNSAAVRNVVGQAAEMGLRSIVHVSSVGALFRPLVPVTPDSPVIPGENAYARSKSAAEIYARELQTAGAPLRITYPTGVIGPHDPAVSEANRAVVTFINDFMPYTSGGMQIVDVRDLATIHARLVDAPAGAGRYIAGGTFHSFGDIGNLLEELTGQKLFRPYIPGWTLRLAGRICDVIKRFVEFELPITKEGMIFATQWAPADSSRTLEELGFAFRDPIETWADTIRSLQRNGHLDEKAIGKLAG